MTPPSLPAPHHLSSRPRNERRLGIRLIFASLPLIGVLVFGGDAASIVTYFWATNLAVLCTEPWFMRLAYQRRRSAPPTHSAAFGPPAGSPSTFPPPGAAPTPSTFPPPGAAPAPPAPPWRRTSRRNQPDLSFPEFTTPAGLVFSVVFFSFHFGMFTLVHFVFLASFGLVAWSALPVAIAVQVVRRAVLERDAEVERLQTSPFPMHLYRQVGVMHAVIMISGFASMAAGDGNSTLAVAIICAAAVAVELSPAVRKPTRTSLQRPDPG
jgi:hypothetical protein